MNEKSKAEKKDLFQSRWRITGSLKVMSNLHIGSGGFIPAIANRDSAESGSKDTENAPDAAAFVTDFKRNPYIPASTLKGNLRSWLEGRFGGNESINEIFGKESTKDDSGIGGKAEFLDAGLSVKRDEGSCINLWNPERQTGIEVSTTINRASRTVREKKLFHLEYVPEGVTFFVEIIGRNLSDQEVALLLVGLEGFNDSDNPITIGGDTRTGKGRLTWEPCDVKYMDRKILSDWVASDDEDLSNRWRDLDGDEKEKLDTEKKGIKTSPSSNDALKLDIRLQFDSPFMVAQPLKKDENDTKNMPDLIARTTADGKLILPGKSVKGVLRSQAERIIRTLVTPEKWKEFACMIDDPKEACEPYEKWKEFACMIDDPKEACKPHDKKSDKQQCLVCQMFGGTGYASRISVSDFICVDERGKEMEKGQEFVAIDRFTGGGAKGAKFNTKPWIKPLMSGTVTFSRDAKKPWALGLLALVIRDLIEGDLTFGYGASKGYGTCRVENQNEVISALNGYANSLNKLHAKLEFTSTTRQD